MACGIVGIAYVVIGQTGVAIPPFIITLLWIVAAVFVGVLLIRALMSISQAP